MDLIINYDLIKNIYLELGDEKFFKIFERTFPNFQLYTMSTSWVESKEYILKFKGGCGDILVHWQ